MVLNLVIGLIEDLNSVNKFRHTAIYDIKFIYKRSSFLKYFS